LLAKIACCRDEGGEGLTDLSGLLNVETIGHEGEVGVQESDGSGNSLLHLVTGSEHELQPTTAALLNIQECSSRGEPTQAAMQRGTIAYSKQEFSNLPLAALGSDVVLDWSSDMTLVEECSVHVLVQQGSL
jgi:hypothetical protein